MKKSSRTFGTSKMFMMTYWSMKILRIFVRIDFCDSDMMTYRSMKILRIFERIDFCDSDILNFRSNWISWTSSIDSFPIISAKTKFYKINQNLQNSRNLIPVRLEVCMKISHFCSLLSITENIGFKLWIYETLLFWIPSIMND